LAPSYWKKRYVSDSTLDTVDVLSYYVASAVLVGIGLPLPGLKWRGKQTGMTRARGTLRYGCFNFRNYYTLPRSFKSLEIRSKCISFEAITGFIPLKNSITVLKYHQVTLLCTHQKGHSQEYAIYHRNTSTLYINLHVCRERNFS